MSARVARPVSPGVSLPGWRGIWHVPAGNEKEKRALLAPDRLGTVLAVRAIVNTPNEQTTTGSAIVHVDPERRAIETRIRLAKARLFQDLNRASTIVKQTAGAASRGLLRVALVGGLLLVGLVSAFVRRRRRLRVTWK